VTTRLLLIGPAFYGLWQGFEAAFSEIGYDARSHLYDDYSSLGAKVRNKLRYELPQRLGRDVENAVHGELTSAALAAVEAHDPDVVLVIKGDVLGDELWDALDARGRPTLLWLYDALTAMSYDRERLARPGAVVSFSRHDVATMKDWGIEADHAHLGFDSLLELPVLPARDEIVFAGARYPARERLLLDLVGHGLPVRAFGRQWSHHPWDRLRTWDPRRPAVPAGRDLDRATASARMRAARASVNVHGKQDGFNLRVFEACGVGGVQLVDRDDVAELYEPDQEIAVYHSAEELVTLCERAGNDRAWAARLREGGARRTAAEHTLVHRARFLESRW
jgi:spore maturation protein CgeB